jgi:hypothetical protein
MLALFFWGRIQINKTDSSNRLIEGTDWCQALNGWTPSWPLAGGFQAIRLLEENRPGVDLPNT